MDPAGSPLIFSPWREILGAAAMVLTFVIFIPYIRSIRAGRTKPHVFSWVIWGLGTAVVGFAQLAGGGGVGAWPIIVSGFITLYIAWLAWAHRADTSITRIDWVFFVTAVSAIPVWVVTSDPLWAVVILTAVDLIGFGPTFRSAWANPHTERAGFFGLAALRNLLVILALERLNLTTVLFPAAVGVGCVALVALIAWRRQVVGNP